MLSLEHIDDFMLTDDGILSCDRMTLYEYIHSCTIITNSVIINVEDEEIDHMMDFAEEEIHKRREGITTHC